jgi:hypothetical protein
VRLCSVRDRVTQSEMRRREDTETPPWKLFALLLAISVPIIAAILLGGPLLGFPVAALVALAVVGIAIRMRPPSGRARAEQRPPRSTEAAWRASAARRFAVSAVVGAVGIVVVVATTGTARIVGWGIVTLALVLAVSLAFLEVGYSEDRARAAERRSGAKRPRRAATRGARRASTHRARRGSDASGALRGTPAPSGTSGDASGQSRREPRSSPASGTAAGG